MDLFFLEAKFPLVKTIEKKGKAIEETPYPMARAFTSSKVQVDSIREFKDALKEQADHHRVLLKGHLNRELYVESRAGSTDPYTKTNWLCLDIDGLPDPDNLPLLLERLGLSQTSHVIQYSSKHNIDGAYKAHLFFMLDEPVLPEQLKVWFKKANLSIPFLADALELTRTSAAMRWPLDISLAQNDKIIYIAPPNFVGMDDPVEKRVELIIERNNFANIAESVSSIDANAVREAENKKLNELRKASGLSAKTFSSKTVAGVQVLSKPGETVVTGKKQERGFMYLNLNGGDSWGYYHPIDNPEIIYNFKGEPNYLTKELIPSYYRSFKKAEFEEQQRDSEEAQYFAFLDRRTDRYYRGTFDPEKQELDIYSTGNKEKVLDFLKQKQLHVPDYIEEWDYLFRFDDSRIFVPEERFINQYQITPLLRDAKEQPGRFPPMIKRVLTSVSGGSPEVLKRLINWMAVIVQKRQRTQTMWVMHGVPGTGKGVLVHEILSPILGHQYIQVKSLSSFEEEYNEYMERCLLLMIDESKRTQLNSHDKVMGKLKQACTDPVVPIRKMRADPYMAKNYMNIIIASNYPDPITLEAGDRRINVADYQDKPLRLDADDIKQIRKELPEFASVLMNIEVDVEAAKTPLQNEARSKLMYLTQQSLEGVFGSIRSGDLQFFIDLLPTDPGLLLGKGTETIDKDAFVQVVREAEKSVGTEHVLTRDQCRVLAQYTLSDMPSTSHKFASLAKHYGVTFDRFAKAGKKVQGTAVKWKKPDIGVDDVIETNKLRAVK